MPFSPWSLHFLIPTFSKGRRQIRTGAGNLFPARGPVAPPTGHSSGGRPAPGIASPGQSPWGLLPGRGGELSGGHTLAVSSRALVWRCEQGTTVGLSTHSLRRKEGRHLRAAFLEGVFAPRWERQGDPVWGGSPLFLRAPVRGAGPVVFAAVPCPFFSLK